MAVVMAAQWGPMTVDRKAGRKGAKLADHWDVPMVVRKVGPLDAKTVAYWVDCSACLMVALKVCWMAAQMEMM